MRALAPPGTWTHEWLVKAGEGGTWQGTWDSHPLALDGPDKLRSLRQQGERLDPPLVVTPYVVVRGRPEWNEAEWEQIAACADVADRVVLNLEPGSQYWNGPKDPTGVREQYLEPMLERVRSRAPRAKLELCAIPRQWVVDELGGRESLRAWLESVSSASWECYDAAAPDLDVGKSLTRVTGWGGHETAYRIPVVQRSRIAAWADTPLCRPGFQVWHLDGDI